jgi:hypothetical protein
LLKLNQVCELWSRTMFCSLIRRLSDLRQALELEPGNAAVKEELSKLADVLERTKVKVSLVFPN